MSKKMGHFTLTNFEELVDELVGEVGTPEREEFEREAEEATREYNLTHQTARPTVTTSNFIPPMEPRLTQNLQSL